VGIILLEEIRRRSDCSGAISHGIPFAASTSTEVHKVQRMTMKCKCERSGRSSSLLRTTLDCSTPFLVRREVFTQHVSESREPLEILIHRGFPSGFAKPRQKVHRENIKGNGHKSHLKPINKRRLLVPRTRIHRDLVTTSLGWSPIALLI
jgi:hypothetical protein